MKHAVTLLDKTIKIELSQAAERAISARNTPIIAEMNLVFGCLVIKRVWFKEQVDIDTVSVTPGLDLCFNVVRYTKTCRIADIDNGAEAEDFPLAKDKKTFVPDNLFIDYKKGCFSGNYTYLKAASRTSA
ncbi:hypothetical protein MNBD_GAMMA24-1964 [hydrothermal vent metagenome]|uniref:Uncharacterized protein n=1 Tax=hydrothermal vent metagenome TaxID=652676 RepID=A0A3B1B1A0_9ZZZZ